MATPSGFHGFLDFVGYSVGGGVQGRHGHVFAAGQRLLHTLQMVWQEEERERRSGRKRRRESPARKRRRLLEVIEKRVTRDDEDDLVLTLAL